MSSIRQQIKENIITTLGGIKVADDYELDVTKVTEDLSEYNRVDSLNMPWLCVVSGTQEYPYATMQQIEVEMHPRIFGVVRAADGKVDTELNKLIYDVERILLVDKTRGGLATMTYLEGLDIGYELEKNIGFMEMELRILYRDTAVK